MFGLHVLWRDSPANSRLALAVRGCRALFGLNQFLLVEVSQVNVFILEALDFAPEAGDDDLGLVLEGELTQVMLLASLLEL